MPSNNITTCFIASNVTKYLFPYEAAIEQARKIGKVIVNVDTDSVDDTVNAIKRLKVEIIESAWGSSTGAGKEWLRTQKQRILDHVETTHLLYLDIDEMLDDDGIAWLIDLVDKEDLRGFSGVRFRYYHFYGDLKHRMPDDAGSGWSTVITRLARKGAHFVKGSDGFGLALNLMETLLSPHRIYHYSHVRPREVWHEKNTMMFARYNKQYNNLQIPWDLVQRFEGKHPEIIGNDLHLFEQGGDLEKNT